MQLGETFGDAARRELRRGTGLTAETLEPLHLYVGAGYRHTDPNGDVTDPVAMLHRARGLGGAPRLQPDDAAEYRWFAPADRPGDLSGPLIRAMLRDALQSG